MLKQITAIVDNAGQARDFIEQALAFAQAQAAHVAVIVLTQDYSHLMAPDFGAFIVEISTLQEEQLESVRSVVAQTGVRAEVRGVLDAAGLLAGASRVEARAADLLLVGPADAFADARLRRRVIEAALMSSGGPLLILPPQARLARVKHAVVGWDGSAEARRAVRDLMTVIDPGGRIEIVSVDRREGDGYGRAPGSDLAMLLSRHGYAVEVHSKSGAGRSPTVVLQDFVAAGADLLAIGAFAHSRIRDILLGGVTRELVESARVPVLLSR